MGMTIFLERVCARREVVDVIGRSYLGRSEEII